MQSRYMSQPLSWLLFATATSAQIIDQLSFGQSQPLSRDGRALPNWQISGENHQPQLLSDKVILTPPVPGNARGALWSENGNPNNEWVAEFEFRASGQDMGTGNLNVWFAKEKSVIGLNSVYTVENFDGLAIVIDQYGSTGGKVRGFLNDGSQNFKAQSALESLAFGHCDYSYRNLGRTSKVKIVNQNGLGVYVDDRECFKTDHISLPSNYFFGLTAATSDNPDSFEVSKFVVSGAGGSQQQAYQPPQQQAVGGDRPTPQKLDRFPGSPEALPDRSADEMTNQNEQFADLHNRLQGMTHQVANVFAEFDTLSRKMEERHNQMMGALGSIQAGSGGGQGGSAVGSIEKDLLQELKRKIDGVEKVVQQVQRDVESKDYRQHMSDLQKAVDNVKGSITDHLPHTMGELISASAPKMGMFVFIIVAVQVMLAGVYIIYKRRRNSMPKKYL
ncbi:hypothetical protein B0A50_02711 [Salinomyces thailandicus]|uniref:L-type lectin-like domain-containing protein n=1 Tax=Salinomyces thailandicus TaxID=706561 RepID=A0A4U0U5Q1_9PEZI|nr:hypothetical protein B0A50_02711 [Salinomyces thailandica]